MSCAMLYINGEKAPQDVAITTTSLAINLQVDSGDANVTYVGKAAIGTATSAASWQVMKIDENTGTVITWADSNALFDNVFDNRESLSYG